MVLGLFERETLSRAVEEEYRTCQMNGSLSHDSAMQYAKVQDAVCNSLLDSVPKYRV